MHPAQILYDAGHWLIAVARGFNWGLRLVSHGISKSSITVDTFQ